MRHAIIIGLLQPEEGPLERPATFRDGSKLKEMV
jgi:hypothetical protein